MTRLTIERPRELLLEHRCGVGQSSSRTGAWSAALVQSAIARSKGGCLTESCGDAVASLSILAGHRSNGTSTSSLNGGHSRSSVPPSSGFGGRLIFSPPSSEPETVFCQTRLAHGLAMKLLLFRCSCIHSAGHPQMLSIFKCLDGKREWRSQSHADSLRAALPQGRRTFSDYQISGSDVLSSAPALCRPLRQMPTRSAPPPHSLGGRPFDPRRLILQQL